MKFLKIFLLSLTLVANVAINTTQTENLSEEYQNLPLTPQELKNELKKKSNVILGTLVTIGSLLSFFFWLPETLKVIHACGFQNAVISTHIPRLVIDFLAVIAGCRLILLK